MDSKMDMEKERLEHNQRMSVQEQCESDCLTICGEFIWHLSRLEIDSLIVPNAKRSFADELVNGMSMRQQWLLPLGIVFRFNPVNNLVDDWSKIFISRKSPIVDLFTQDRFWLDLAFSEMSRHRAFKNANGRFGELGALPGILFDTRLIFCEERSW